MWRIPACETLLKILDILSVTVIVALDLLKALAILSDTTVKRSAVNPEDLKPSWKLEKTPNFSKWSSVKINNTLGTQEYPHNQI